MYFSLVIYVANKLALASKILSYVQVYLTLPLRHHLKADSASNGSAKANKPTLCWAKAAFLITIFRDNEYENRPL